MAKGISIVRGVEAQERRTTRTDVTQRDRLMAQLLQLWSSIVSVFKTVNSSAPAQKVVKSDKQLLL